MKKRTISKNDSRKHRHARVRARISGTRERPRLAVYRSNHFISAQVVDDEAGKTLASAHGREFGGSLGTQATAVGKAVAERAIAAGISSVVFDRGGYVYAAQIRSLADAARAGKLLF